MMSILLNGLFCKFILSSNIMLMRFIYVEAYRVH